jgi:hypothetical protein
MVGAAGIQRVSMERLRQVRPVTWWTLVTLLVFWWMSGFLGFGPWIPITNDIHPAMVHQLRFYWPPSGFFVPEHWLGSGLDAPPFSPLSLAAHLPEWVFFAGVYGVFTALCVPAAYAMLRELQFSPPAAVTGAMVYAWQGEVFSTIYPGHFAHLMMSPLLPLAILFAVRSGRAGEYALAAFAGVVTGLLVALLPDRGALCSFLVAAVYGMDAWHRGAHHRWIALANPLARLAITAAVAAGVAWPVLLSITRTAIIDVQETVEAASPEQRYEWTTQWSHAPEELITNLVPGFFGWRNGSDEGPYWGRIGQSAEWPETQQGFRNFALANYSLGTVGTILVVAGFAALFLSSRHPYMWNSERQRRYAAFFAAAGLVALILALGKHTPVYGWFYELPYMSTWRNPNKFLMPAYLCGTILAAAGAQFLGKLLDRAGTYADASRWVGLLLAATTGALALLFVGSWAGFGSLRMSLQLLAYSESEINAITANLKWSLFMAAWVAGGMAALWHGLRRGMSPPPGADSWPNPWIQRRWNAFWAPGRAGRSFLTGLCVLVALQMAWVQQHYLQFIRSADFLTLPPPMAHLAWRDEPFRVAVFPGPSVLQNFVTFVFPANGVLSIDIPAASRVASDYDQWFRVLSGKPKRKHLLAGVRYFVVPEQVADEAANDSGLGLNPDTGKMVALPFHAYAKPNHVMFEIADWLPKATVVPRLEVLPSSQAVFSYLVNESWNPRRSLLVDAETAKQHNLTATPASSAGEEEISGAAARVKSYGPAAIVVEVESPRPAWLRINDRFDPHWRAKVNGQPSPIFRVDGIMRGVAIPAGRSEVEMVYVTSPWPVIVQMATLGIVGAGAIVWGIGQIHGRRYSRSTPS